MVTYEAFLPVADPRAGAVPIATIRHTVDELADRFGIIDAWSVYRPLDTTEYEVVEQELYRLLFDVPNTDDNHIWLLHWRQAQDQRFGGEIWMIRYRQT